MTRRNIMAETAEREQLQTVFRAMVKDRRLLIFDLLKNPWAHFPEQVDGDLVKDGVCGLLIAEKLAVSQPIASEHRRVLSQSGVVKSNYRCDESYHARVNQLIHRM